MTQSKIAEFPERLKHYQDGLISWSEFLIAVQLAEEEKEILCALHKLPFAAYSKIKPADLVAD